MTPTQPAWMTWTGRILSALICFALTMSAVMKFGQSADIVKEFNGKFGYPAASLVPIGAVEVACMILYAIPQTSVLGAMLLTGYLGGATATHVRVTDPWFGPVIMGVVMWLGLYLREPRLRALVPFRSSRSAPPV